MKADNSIAPSLQRCARLNITCMVRTIEYEVATVTASSDNTGLIVGVVILGVLFVASGLVALYLFCYIKRLAMIYIVYFHGQIPTGLASGMLIPLLVIQQANQ